MPPYMKHSNMNIYGLTCPILATSKIKIKARFQHQKLVMKIFLNQSSSIVSTALLHYLIITSMIRQQCMSLLTNRNYYGWRIIPSNTERRRMLLTKQLSASATTDTLNNGNGEKCISNGNKKNKNKNKNKKQGLQRVDRILSNRGVGSRTEVTRLLKQKGRVCRVITECNADEVIPIKSPSEKIPIDSVITIDGSIDVPAIPLLKVFHKPKNVLSAMNASTYEEENNITHLGDHLPHHLQGQLHPVGRLDLDSSGLLLFSSVGTLTQRLLHPRYQIEKEYVATVEGDVVESTLRRLLKQGVSTTEGVHKAKLVEVIPSKLNNETSASEVLHYDVRLVVTEGKHRMVRRMLANVGHPVIELRRERLGNILLGDDLPPGQFRDLHSDELHWVTSDVYTP